MVEKSEQSGLDIKHTYKHIIVFAGPNDTVKLLCDTVNVETIYAIYNNDFIHSVIVWFQPLYHPSIHLFIYPSIYSNQYHVTQHNVPYVNDSDFALTLHTLLLVKFSNNTYCMSIICSLKQMYFTTSN